jgi:hypothetical protein
VCEIETGLFGPNPEVVGVSHYSLALIIAKVSPERRDISQHSGG